MLGTLRREGDKKLRFRVDVLQHLEPCSTWRLNARSARRSHQMALCAIKATPASALPTATCGCVGDPKGGGIPPGTEQRRALNRCGGLSGGRRARGGGRAGGGRAGDRGGGRGAGGGDHSR